MRQGWLVSGCAALLVLGCEPSSPPQASREPARSSPRVAIPNRLPAGHPPIGEDEAPVPQDLGHTVRLDSITLTAPDAWTRKPVRSSFIQAEFALPRADGDSADGRLTVSTAGGSVEANIERWKGQFSGGPEAAKPESLDVAGLQVTLVDLSGDFNDQPGPFAPAVKRSGYRMIAAIIPIDGQLHFVKAVGPQKTMAARADEIKAFVRSLKTAKE